MDKNSAGKLAKVHPLLSQLIATLIANLATLGIDARVVQGLRTYAEQDALYAQGRSKPGKRVTNARGGQSNHNFGLAVDFCVFKDGQPDWNDLKPYPIIGREAKKLGLEWGGDWATIKDMPHVQLKGLSVKQCQQLYAKGGLLAVWDAMNHIQAGGSMNTFAPEVATPVPSHDELLEFGDKGDAVKDLQLQLVKLNLLREWEVDGQFGKKTKNAVIGFQRQHNLTADGIVGDGTKAKLKAALGA